MNEESIQLLKDIGFNLKEIDGVDSFNGESYVEIIPWKSKKITGYLLAFLGLILLPNLSTALVLIINFLLKDEIPKSIFGLILTTAVGVFGVMCLYRGSNRVFSALNFKIMLQGNNLTFSRRIDIRPIVTKHSEIQSFKLNKRENVYQLIAEARGNSINLVQEKIGNRKTAVALKELTNYLNSKL